MSLKNKRVSSIEHVLQELRKTFGDEAAFSLNEKERKRDIEVIPTGSIGLDIVTGIGGYPRGRVIEALGSEGSGKTTLALHAIAEANKLGGCALFVDAEHALDAKYAQALGVDFDKVVIAQPNCGEEALDIVEKAVGSSEFDIVVIDSVAALVPRAEIEGQMGDFHVGVQARLMSQALRKITHIVNKSKTCVFFINQIRQLIGVKYGPTTTTTGGNALKFYASMRFDVKRVESIKEGNDVKASRVRVKVIKNKLAPPFKEVEFIMTFGFGIDKEMDLISAAEACGLVQAAGAWYTWSGKKYNGRLQLAELLKAESGQFNEMRSLVCKHYKIGEVGDDVDTA